MKNWAKCREKKLPFFSFHPQICLLPFTSPSIKRLSVPAVVVVFLGIYTIWVSDDEKKYFGQLYPFCKSERFFCALFFSFSFSSSFVCVWVITEEDRYVRDEKEIAR